MVRTTVVAVTIDGTVDEVKDVAAAVLDKVQSQRNGVNIDAEANEVEAASKDENPSIDSGLLKAEVRYQFKGISLWAKRALWIMALHPEGVTVKQLYEKLEVLGGQGLSGVFSSTGSARRRSPMHLNLYRRQTSEPGAPYKMSPEIARIILLLVQEDEDLREWDPSLV